jgi:hypothetical protein
VGKYTGHEIMNNLNPEFSNRFQSHDWSQTKAASMRRVEASFRNIQNGPSYPERTARLVVIAVDCDTGEIIGGRMEV